MDIGIIGSGQIGGALVRRLADTDHGIAVANTRGPDSLRELVTAAGPRARAATPADAVAFGEMVVVAVPLRAWDDLIVTLGAEAFAGRVIVDTTNYYPRRDGQIEDLDADRLAASELVARRLPGARVVKAFNTIYASLLGEDGRPDQPLAERLAIPVAADDDEAKALVSRLIEEIGFAPVDGGTLAGSRRQQPGTPVYGAQIGPEEAASLLRDAG